MKILNTSKFKPTKVHHSLPSRKVIGNYKIPRCSICGDIIAYENCTTITITGEQMMCNICTAIKEIEYEMERQT